MYMKDNLDLEGIKKYIEKVINDNKEYYQDKDDEKKFINNLK